MRIQRGNNKTTHLMGRTMDFMMILCISLLVVSVGVTYARYWEEHHGDVDFQVRESETVFLGTIDNNVFTQANQLEWKVEDEVVTLQFAVANGLSETDYSNIDQKVQLSLIGSLGLLKNGQLPTAAVTFQTEGGETKTVWAIASAIEKGTMLYHSYGDGWLYRFYEYTEEGNRELRLELPGGEFSCIDMLVTVQGETSERLSFLQPLISAEAIEND